MMSSICEGWGGIGERAKRARLSQVCSIEIHDICIIVIFALCPLVQASSVTFITHKEGSIYLHLLPEH